MESFGYLELSDFCEQLGLNKRLVLEAAKSGELKAAKVGNKWLSTKNDIDTWIANIRKNQNQNQTDK